MASSEGLGTIAVGSVSELANILTNMTPEQLQNVRLDPVLYNALSQTIEPIPQSDVLDAASINGMQKPVSQSTQSISEAVIQHPVNFITSSVNEVLNQPINPELRQTDFVGTPLLQTASQQFMLCNPETTHATIIQPEQVQSILIANPEIQLSEQNSQTVLVDSTQDPLQNIIQTNQVALQDFSEIQGILPGQSSSLIVTPTYMSQVQPTATVQTLKLTNTPILQSSIPSSSSMNIVPQMQLPHTIMTPVALGNTTLHTSPLKTSIISGTVSKAQTMSGVQSVQNTSSITQNVLPSLLNGTQGQHVLMDGNTLIRNVVSGNAIPAQQLVISGVVDATQPVLLNETPPQSVILSDTGQPVIVSGMQTVLIPTQTNIVTCQPMLFGNGNRLVQAGLSNKSPIRNQRAQLDPSNGSTKILLQNGTKLELTSDQLLSAFQGKQVVTTVKPNQATALPIRASFKTNTKSTPSKTPLISTISKKPSTIVKTVNVISRSEAQVVQMKPKSIEQVQPGVFKFQLTKVDDNDLAAGPAEKVFINKPIIVNTVTKTVKTIPKSKENKVHKFHQYKGPDEGKVTTPITSLSNNTSSNLLVQKSVTPGKSTSKKFPFSLANRPHAAVVGAKTSPVVTSKKFLDPNVSGKISSNLKILTSVNDKMKKCVSGDEKFQPIPSSYKVKLPSASLRMNSPVLAKSSTMISKAIDKLNQSLSKMVTSSPTLSIATSSFNSHNSPNKTVTTSMQLAFVSSKAKGNISTMTVKSAEKSSVKPVRISSISVESGLNKLTALPNKEKVSLSTVTQVATSLNQSSKSSSSLNVRTSMDSTKQIRTTEIAGRKRKNSIEPELSALTDSSLECNERGFVSPVNDGHKSPTKFTKVSFTRSFKKQDEIKKSGTNESSNCTEEESFRKIIKSCKTGDEGAMRELAKLEIENQLKRFSSKAKDPAQNKPKILPTPTTVVKSSPALVKLSPALVKTKKTSTITTANLAKLDEDSSVFKRRKTQNTISNENSNDVKFSPVTDNKRLSSSDEKNGNDICPDDNQSASNTAKMNEDSRKRERPKRFDDFVLPSKVKKKTKKFFFPKEISPSVKLTDVGKHIGSPKVEENTNCDVKERSTTELVDQGSESSDNLKIIVSEQRKTQRESKQKHGRKKKRKPNKICVELEVLPEHLKTKPKVTEDSVIDLSKVKLKNAFAESTFNLHDVVQYKTYKLLAKQKRVCTFCNKPGNIGSLDILFGPYKLKVKCRDDAKDISMSVWLHRDCAIWTSSICISNQILTGLGDALEAAAISSCSLCSQVGATLECGFKQCRDGYHFVCAKQRGKESQKVAKSENRLLARPK